VISEAHTLFGLEISMLYSHNLEILRLSLEFDPSGPSQQKELAAIDLATCNSHCDLHPGHDRIVLMRVEYHLKDYPG
jgi:hypothetical protein